MSARIKIATTPEEIDAVFQVRHRVYVEEEGYMAPHPDGRIYDRFDALPTTANIIAIVGDRVVGTMRFMEDSRVGTSADAFFDFAAALAARGLGAEARVGAGSQLAVEREYRKQPGLSFSLMAMGYYWAISRGLTHIKGAANPDALSIFRGTGFEPIGPELFDEAHKLRFVPLVLDLAMLNDRFLDFISRQDIQHYLHGFERQFNGSGEVVVVAGDVASDAFVIVHGEAVVVDPEGREIARLGAGDVFGELALMAGSRRTATVIAGTDLDLMVLSRASFEHQISTNPAVAMKLLRLVASRVAPPAGGAREPARRGDAHAAA